MNINATEHDKLCIQLDDGTRLWLTGRMALHAVQATSRLTTALGRLIDVAALEHSDRCECELCEAVGAAQGALEQLEGAQT